jgi:hypothetical protein
MGDGPRVGDGPPTCVTGGAGGAALGSDAERALLGFIVSHPMSWVASAAASESAAHR